MENYEKVEKIGRGNYGLVYLIRRKSDKQLFALKRVPIDLDASNGSKAINNEIHVLKQLNHVNVVQYHDSFIEKDYLCIVMDYCEKGDLQKRIKSAKSSSKIFQQTLILDWFVQLCLGVQHIHNKKVLHRDLKTSNVFITKGNRVKIGDFGISKILENTVQLAGTSLGTPYYLSPEICLGQKYDYKSDMWMLGCILYELCTL